VPTGERVEMLTRRPGVPVAETTTVAAALVTLPPEVVAVTA
jgi:hypothetical protein